MLQRQGCFSGGSVVKNKTNKTPPANAGVSSSSLGGEDPLQKEVATYFSIPAWEIPRTEEAGGLQSTGSQRVR